MSKYYNAKRIRSLYSSSIKKPFRVSRSKLELFINCPRCFYLDRKLGIGRPPGFPFTINSLIDSLLKKEFDLLRKKSQPHPLMVAHNIDAIPYQHENLDDWRSALHKGIQYLHEPTQFLVTGGIDDVWVHNKSKKLHIVDYKATAKKTEVNIDATWQQGYKRQLEVYQWLFRQNGFEVSDTGYFVYCNADTTQKAFNKNLGFKIKIIPYEGKDNWVEETLIQAHECLNSSKLPEPFHDCDYCNYRLEAKVAE